TEKETRAPLAGLDLFQAFARPVSNFRVLVTLGLAELVKSQLSDFHQLKRCLLTPFERIIAELANERLHLSSAGAAAGMLVEEIEKGSAISCYPSGLECCLVCRHGLDSRSSVPGDQEARHSTN